MKIVKSIFPILVLIASTFFANAQTSDIGFSFQGYAIDPDGKALGNEHITVRFTINSTPQFQEEHQVISDAFGVFHATVGNSSTAKNTEFSHIDFTKKGTIYTLRVEVMKTSGGQYTIISNEPMKAVPYARHAANGVPVGTIIAYAGNFTMVPEGWLICDGRSFAYTEYPQLSAVLGNTWGGNGTNFYLPDLRGRFLRGLDLNHDGTNPSSITDPDANSRTALHTGGNTGNLVGSYQDDATAGPNTPFTTGTDGLHSHNYTDPTNDPGLPNNNMAIDDSGTAVEYPETNAVATTESGSHSHSISGGGDNETRPKNAAVFYIIKY